MNKNILLENIELRKVPILSDEVVKSRYDKGWSYSNVYSLKPLRDIYLISSYSERKSLGSITQNLRTSAEKCYNDWNERKVLEYINALKNFKLIGNDLKIIPKTGFEKKEITSLLTTEDLEIFKNIFFSYFRFKEISSWFIKPIPEIHKNFEEFQSIDYIVGSSPLYYFSLNNRFTNSFLTTIDNPKVLYQIDESMSHLMRFWDVYLKWGTTLNLLEKFNLQSVGYKVGSVKEISIAYFIKPFERFDLINFIESNFKGRHIRIPDLILEIIKKYRFSVEAIKDYLISEIKVQDRLTYERTSEIFLIKGKTTSKNQKDATYLYPTLQDNYLSHIILRK